MPFWGTSRPALISPCNSGACGRDSAPKLSKMSPEPRGQSPHRIHYDRSTPSLHAQDGGSHAS